MSDAVNSGAGYNTIERLLRLLSKYSLTLLGSRAYRVGSQSDYDFSTSDAGVFYAVEQDIIQNGFKCERDKDSVGICVSATVPVDIHLISESSLKRHAALVEFLKTLDPNVVNKKLVVDIIELCQVNDDAVQWEQEAVSSNE